jgi:hypothetical protein
MNFEDIQSIEDLAVVSEEVVWQNFERLAAFIFEKNNFKVKVNSVKTHNKNTFYGFFSSCLHNLFCGRSSSIAVNAVGRRKRGNMGLGWVR